MANNPKNVEFSQVIEELLDNSKIFSPVYLHRFSDLTALDLKALKEAWPKVDPRRRYNLMEDLEELSEADTLMCFDELCFMALEDEEPQVRAAAIRMLWETNDTGFSRRLVEIAENDPDEIVRAAAASGLGLYIYLGEIEEIPQEQLNQLEDTLLKITQGSDTRLVRRRALEALGFSSRPEVPGLIERAYINKELDWRTSALFAMGRSADTRWKKQVIDSLGDPEPEIRFQAIRAAGELELKSARQPIMELLADAENREDDDLLRAIIWALSQIGGNNVRKVIETLLDQAKDPEEEEFITGALDNLGLTEGMDIFGMLDIDIDEDLDDDIDTYDLDFTIARDLLSGEDEEDDDDEDDHF